MKKTFCIFFIIILCFSFSGLAYANEDDFDTTVNPGCPAPQFSNENPSNGSTIDTTTCDWNITIENYVTFNWTIDCSNGQSSNGNDDTNNTFYLNMTGLLTLTLYTVWVNATNGNLSSNVSYIFTVIIPSAPTTTPGGGGWVPPTDEEIVEEPEPIVSGFIMTSVGMIILGLFVLFILILIMRRRKKK